MQDDLTLAAYHYHLPQENIAQHPADTRDLSRLLLFDRTKKETRHLQFTDIKNYISPGDALVINNTKVFRARLNGRKETGGKAEVFLLGYPVPVDSGAPLKMNAFECEALVKSSRKPQAGSAIIIGEDCRCTLLENTDRGKWRVKLQLPAPRSLERLIDDNGDVPLPPYINRPDGTSSRDGSRYQTVYADKVGAVAAPTAGLHFTDELLTDLGSKGVTVVPLTLHVGYGTFSPVETEIITDHLIHREYIELTPANADKLNGVKNRKGKIWAVGTTSVRTLEFCAAQGGQISAYSGWCDLYIYPGYRFKVVDNLITNFHLPQSSLMFLVSALCGRENLLECYRLAIENGYRFYSYGDAMAVIS